MSNISIDKEFCDAGVSSDPVAREEKSKLVGINSSKDQSLSLPLWKKLNIIQLLLSDWPERFCHIESSVSVSDASKLGIQW